MARIATRDTFGFEHVGQGVEVRRLIKAGTRAPSNLRLGEEDAFTDDGREYGKVIGEPPRRRAPQRSAHKPAAKATEKGSDKE